jgi:hypothetical protein
MAERLNHVKDLPVKLFINCKNTKRKAQPCLKYRKEEGYDEMAFDLQAAGEEVISREEVYYTGKENIEGLACLVNVFVRQLSVPFDNVAMINVDNHDDEMNAV